MAEGQGEALSGGLCPTATYLPSSTTVLQSLSAPLFFPSAPVPGRAQHGLQELLDLVGIRVHFGAVEQERELPTRAELLYSLRPSAEGTTRQGRKRGGGGVRNRDFRM